jgi:hypothetical protein
MVSINLKEASTMEQIVGQLREWCAQRGIDGFRLVFEFGDRDSGLKLDSELCVETNKGFNLTKNEGLVAPHRQFRFDGVDVEIRD